jgi:glycosyltransferase involved in cell wall biosynthesis
MTTGIIELNRKGSFVVSIIILTHNAPEFVKKTLETLALTSEPAYETIVLDNASDAETQRVLWEQKEAGRIDKLILLNENTFFSKGNNLAARFCGTDCRHICLLNSDVKILDPLWLKRMLDVHKRGVTALGSSLSKSGRFLAHGYCYLIDRDLYEAFPLREDYGWWGPTVYNQCQVLSQGHAVRAITRHEELLHHYWGKSGDDWKAAKNVDQDLPAVYDEWLDESGGCVEEIFSLSKTIGSDKDTYNPLRGISDDDWCAPLADLRIRTGQSGCVAVKGYYPWEITGAEKIECFANGSLAVSKIIDGAVFSFEIPAPANSDVRIVLDSQFSRQADPPDIRTLSFVLTDISAT